MSRNHMLIGLGGTGGKILRAFRKRIFESFRAEDPPDLRLRYLYVDSSAEMMGHDDPSWKVLGQSVQLPQRSQLKISGLNLKEVIDNLGNYPNVSPWLGSRDRFGDIINAADAGQVVGGQKRRLGRFLFACRAAEFRRQVGELVTDAQTGGVKDTTFHVCCGLAGGTGSGSVVDVLAQLRTLYRDSAYRVLVYAQLPEQFPAAYRAGANYHANGYAALAELNALAVGAYRPHDVSGVARGRLELQDPFNCCYLFTDENEDRNRVELDAELPEIVASFLYQKIVAVREMKWDSLARQESYEIGTQANFPETSASGAKPERTRQFFGFGIKQLAYPEQEIREYLTLAFSRQATLQLQYNHWVDSLGYVDEAVNEGFNEFVRQKDVLERWALSDEHLTLSVGILADEMRNKRWKPVGTYWADLLPNFKAHVREGHAARPQAWLDELARLCEENFAGNYRDLGVVKFYQTKEGDTRDHAREIRRRIEGDLFLEWANGTRSMHDLHRLLQALTTALTERHQAIDERVVKVREAVARVEEKVSAHRREWVKVGVITGWLGKRDRLFDAQAEALQELFTLRTRERAWGFARTLVLQISAEIGGLLDDVGRAATTIEQGLKLFSEGIDARCTDGETRDLARQVVRVYNPEAVKDFARALVRDKAEQQRQAGAVRGALASLLGENQTFTAFAARIPLAKFVDVIERACEQSAVEAHNRVLAENRDRTRILQVSLVERLYREFGGNREALRGFVREVVSHARTYLPLNSAEIRRAGPGIPGTEAAVSYLTVVLPDAPEFSEFLEVLKEEFRAAVPGPKEIVINARRPHEITLVAVTSVLPARFVSAAAFLKEKYDERTSGADGDAARFELHAEGDGRQFPPLFQRRVSADDLLPYVLLAKALGLLQTLEDPDSGESGLYLLTRNAQGREGLPERLGRDEEDALNAPDPVLLDRLEALVRASLDGEHRHRTRREELRQRVGAQVDEVRAARKNPLDRKLRSYVQASERVEAVLVGGE